MKKFVDLKELFIKDLMKLKYKNLYNKFVDEKELITEKEETFSSINEVKQIAELINILIAPFLVWKRYYKADATICITPDLNRTIFGIW